jgi:hypothetical protein
VDRLAIFTLLSVVILFVSSPSTAAPVTVTFALTGGSQNFIWDGGPIASGRLKVTFAAAGCSQPPVSGTAGCIHTFTFYTTNGAHAHITPGDYLGMFAGFTRGTFLSYGTGHRRRGRITNTFSGCDWDYGGSCFLSLHQTTQGALHSTLPNMLRSIRCWGMGCSFDTVSGLRGHEINYPPAVPSGSRRTHLLLIALLLITPLVVIRLRHQAARANRRRS